jgi:ribonuclease BN (tRNA processing enzyme)
MVDCGPAATHKLVKAGMWPTNVDYLFFTHHHFDHDVDYPCFLLCRWDQSIGKENRLQVYGPNLTEQLTHRILDENEGAFAHDWKSRVNFHVSQKVYVYRGGTLPRTPPDVFAKDVGPGNVCSTDDWQMTAAPAEHVQPYLDSLAYRVDTDGGSVVITGDTRPCESVTELARGADSLMMMCWESHDHVGGTDHDLATCSIRGAAETAAAAGVRQLVMVHIGARLRNPEMAEARAREAESAFDGEIVWGEELMQVSAP